MILELHDVVSGYGRSASVRGVTAAFHEGSATTVIGPNGTGKSTLMKAVGGLLVGVRMRTCRRSGARTIAGSAPRMAGESMTALRSE